VSAGVWALFLAVFLACAVEAVEATTIVLAAGTARDWRSAATGTGAALVALAVIVAVAGPAVRTGSMPSTWRRPRPGGRAAGWRWSRTGTGSPWPSRASCWRAWR